MSPYSYLLHPHLSFYWKIKLAVTSGQEPQLKAGLGGKGKHEALATSEHIGSNCESDGNNV